jgi:O-antigen ligase
MRRFEDKGFLNYSIILICCTFVLAITQFSKSDQSVVLLSIVGIFSFLFFLFNRVWLVAFFIALSFFDFSIEGLTYFKLLGYLLMAILVVSFLFRQIDVVLNDRLLILFMAIFLICSLSQLVNRAFVPFYLNKLLMIFCMMISINVFIRNLHELKIVLFILAFAGFIAAGITIYEVILNPDIKRVSGSLGNPNNTAAIFCMLMPFSVIIMRQKWGKRSLLIALVYVLILIVAIFLSASRGALINLIFITLFAFVMFNWKAKILLIAFLLVSVIVVLTFFENYRGLERYEKLMTEGELMETRAVKIRMEITAIGMTLFLENPIWGIGSGSFRNETQGMGTEYNGYLYDGIAPHNMYTQILAELGIIGFFIFAWFYFTIFEYLYSGIAHPRAEMRLISRVLIFSFFAMLISMISSGNYLKPFIYVIAGFALVIKKLTENQAPSAKIQLS